MNWLFEVYNIHTSESQVAIGWGDTWQQAWLDIVIGIGIQDYLHDRFLFTVLPISRIEPYD